MIDFLEAILDRTLRNTVALIAARGRGKSAALGLAVAGAVVAGLYAWIKQNFCFAFFLVALDFSLVVSNPFFPPLFFSSGIRIFL